MLGVSSRRWISAARFGSDFYDELIAACRALSFSPQVRFESRGAETMLALVAAGLGVSIRPQPYRNLARTGVAFRPLQGRPPTTATSQADTSPVLRRFLQVLSDSE